MTSSVDIDEEAARWAVRLDGEPLRENEQAEMEAWLAAQPRHAGALLRAEAALSLATRARALAEPTAINGSHRLLSRRAMLGGTIGSACAAAVLGVFWRTRPGLRTQTAVGELSRLALADGSSIAINTDSRLATRLLPHQRDVTLSSGEAWFQVAHDKARPFVVEAGDVRVQAIGTAFAVRRRTDGADVLVTEGAVEAWSSAHPETRTRIAAGSRAYVADDAEAVTVVPGSDEVERLLAWRSGQLALDGEDLAYAAAELNRYNSRHIMIADEALGRETLVGYFRVDRPEDFARAAAKLTGARVEVRPDEIVISR